MSIPTRAPPTRFETAHAPIAPTAHRTTKISKSNIQYIIDIELKSRPPPRTSLTRAFTMSSLEEFAKAIETGDSSMVELVDFGWFG
jgi:hypothetical protein